jgi:hypothetical protein
MLRRAAGAIAIAAAVGLAADARAGAGNGIKFGDGRLHPFLDLEPRYDSNVTLGVNGETLGDVALHLRPGLRFEADGEILVVRLDAFVDRVQYLGLEGDTKDLSRLDAGAGIGLVVNKKGSVGLELEDRFTRSDETRSLSIPQAVISNANGLRLRVPWRPGGGALVLAAGGEWLLESFEPYLKGFTCDPTLSPACDSSLLGDLGYNEYRATAEVRWRFLPRTSASVRATWLDRAPNDSTLSTAGSGLKAVAGVSGLVTTHLAGTLEAGYGDTFDSLGTPFSTWLANVEVEWIGTEDLRAKLAYTHGYDFDPGRTTSVYESDRISAVGHAALGKLALALDVRFDRLDYVLTDSTAQIAQVSPTAELEIARWMRLGVGYRLTVRTSTGTLSNLPAWDYTKHEAWLSARLVY